MSASLGDAQVQDFPAGGFDVVVSRFGVMFFADSAVAFDNLRSATVTGGRLAFVAWQGGPLDEWVLVPMMALIPHVGPPNLPGVNAPGLPQTAERRTSGRPERATKTELGLSLNRRRIMVVCVGKRNF